MSLGQMIRLVLVSIVEIMSLHTYTRTLSYHKAAAGTGPKDQDYRMHRFVHLKYNSALTKVYKPKFTILDIVDKFGIILSYLTNVNLLPSSFVHNHRVYNSPIGHPLLTLCCVIYSGHPVCISYYYWIA